MSAPVATHEESRVRYGVSLPHLDLCADRGALRAFVHAVEECGFDYVSALDHIVGASPPSAGEWAGKHSLTDFYAYGSIPVTTIFFESLSVLSYVTAVAPDLGLVTSVIVAPQRQTVLLAKQAAQLDVLSGGQLRLGVGVGWNRIEYDAFGRSFSGRGAMLEEQIHVLRRLWTEEIVSFAGKHHVLDHVGINPRPLQRPIPLWIGGEAEPALRRAAVLADGFIPQRWFIGERPKIRQGPLHSGWPEVLDRLRGWRRAAGLDPSTFGLVGRIQLSEGHEGIWTEWRDEWVSLGATHIDINTSGSPPRRDVDSHIERLHAAASVLGAGPHGHGRS